MDLIYCGRKNIKDYVAFTRDVYADNRYYRDSLSSILNMVLYGESRFSQSINFTPVMVVEGDCINAACTFITSEKYAGVLQMAFFEARNECQKAVDLMVETAVNKCRREGMNTIIVGLNGHVNYGLGFLSDNYDIDPVFGSSYNPDYYIDYFSKYNCIQHDLVSYLADMKRVKVGLFIPDRIMDRVNRRFTFREADFNNLNREIEIYTDLNNVCFKGHQFYWERTQEEDFEMLEPFKHFIRGENLIIAEKNGEPIGFLLWYPDFNQLIKPGGQIGVGTYLKNKLMSRKINKFKIAEIGIVPKYQGSGAALGLFNKCMELTKDRYEWCETSWILDKNMRSRGFGIKWEAEEYKHYKVFEIKV